MNRRALAIAGALALVPLSGCATTPTAAEVVSETSDAGGTAPIDADTLDELEARKAAFDDWMYGWLSSGCDEERAASGDLECASLLSFGQLEAGATSIAFGSLPDFGIVDEGAQAVAVVAAEADAAGVAWADAGCAGDASLECATLARELVQRLGGLQDGLLQWSR